MKYSVYGASQTSYIFRTIDHGLNERPKKIFYLYSSYTHLVKTMYKNPTYTLVPQNTLFINI